MAKANPIYKFHATFTWAPSKGKNAALTNNLGADAHFRGLLQTQGLTIGHASRSSVGLTGYQWQIDGDIPHKRSGPGPMMRARLAGKAIKGVRGVRSSSVKFMVFTITLL